MATMIPPLNFTRSPESFSTAMEQQSIDGWQDSSSTTSVQTSIAIPRTPINKTEIEDDGWSTVAETVELNRRWTFSSNHTAIKDYDPFSTEHTASTRKSIVDNEHGVLGKHDTIAVTHLKPKDLESASSPQNKLVKQRHSVTLSKASPRSTVKKAWTSYRVSRHRDGQTESPFTD